MNQKIIYLTPPKFSENNIKEKIVCIRAHKERMFEISAEKTDNKLIINNYGQGGAGWTFLFGCVNKSIRLFEAENPQSKEIVVLGAGCYGLLTAIILKANGYKVRIIAKEVDNLPSTKAAGFFFPRPRKASNAQEIEIFKALSIESYSIYLQIIGGKHPFIKSGPKLLPAYYGLDIDPGFKPFIEKKLIAEPERVTIDFQNGKIYEVFEYKTVFINPSEIMAELKRNIKELNIDIEIKEISSFDEIEESVIFNCTNLGAKALTNDKKVVPIQGHLITLKDQPIESLQYMLNTQVVMTNPNGSKRDELIYFAPKNSGIVGITFIRGQDSLTANLHEFDRLLQRCRDYFGT